MYHSQFDQDHWVIEEVFPNKTDGYFIEIGAADGIQFSNTKALEDLGWTGILVEPHPIMAALCRMNRKSQVIQKAIASHSGKVSFTAYDPRSGSHLLSGITKPLEPGYLEAFPQLAVSPKEVIEVEALTVSDFLKEVTPPAVIHYLSIDTEGTELEILEGFPFEQYQVLSITVEHNACHVGHKNQNDIFTILSRVGYTRVKTHPVDDFYLLAP